MTDDEVDKRISGGQFKHDEDSFVDHQTMYDQRIVFLDVESISLNDLLNRSFGCLFKGLTNRATFDTFY